MKAAYRLRSTHRPPLGAGGRMTWPRRCPSPDFCCSRKDKDVAKVQRSYHCLPVRRDPDLAETCSSPARILAFVWGQSSSK